MNSKFVYPNNPILSLRAKTIPLEKIKTKEIQKIIETMQVVSLGKRKDKKKPLLVGLAAPQIGISKKIIAVDTGADGKGNLSHLQIFINPRILKKSRKREEWYEGCWSTGRVCGIVSRSKSITLVAYTTDGNLITKQYEGYVARIIQHEVDHLSGILFADLITTPAHLHWVEESEFGMYRNNEQWRNWSKLCSFGKWEKIKSSPL